MNEKILYSSSIFFSIFSACIYTHKMDEWIERESCVASRELRLTLLHCGGSYILYICSSTSILHIFFLYIFFLRDARWEREREHRASSEIQKHYIRVLYNFTYREFFFSFSSSSFIHCSFSSSSSRSQLKHLSLSRSFFSKRPKYHSPLWWWRKEKIFSFCCSREEKKKEKRIE